MKLIHLAIVALVNVASGSLAQEQSDYQALLCKAAETGQSVELVYDKDVSKGCLPRVIDVHQVGLGKRGKLFMHGWQTRGCTAGRDFESSRVFRFDKIEFLKVIEGDFNAKSKALKAEGWKGCIGTNCFIKENICE